MFERIIFILQNYGNLFLKGLWVTVYLAFLTVFFGAIIGSVIAIIRNSNIHFFGNERIKPFNWILTAYVEIIRGTPLLLQLYFFYFIAPKIIGQDISKTISVLMALIINSSGYVAEIFRAGIQAVDKGQSEAARSLGLSRVQTMLKVVFPQAIKNILPALGNEFVMIIKETSLASTFFIGDIMTQSRKVTGALYITIEPLLIAAVIYFVLTFTLSKGIEKFERGLAESD